MTRTLILALAIALTATPALAQMGQGGGGGQGQGQGQGQGRQGNGQGQRQRDVAPVERRHFDEAVEAMFVRGDANRDGLVTMDELRGIFLARRQEIIGRRFGEIDADGSQTIDAGEFFAWQERLGSAVGDDGASRIAEGPVREAIMPELDDNARGRMIGRMIDPLATVVVTQANTDYDAGMTLEELLAYQGQRFAAADTDGDGKVTMDELGIPRRADGGSDSGFGSQRGRGQGQGRNRQH